MERKGWVFFLLGILLGNVGFWIERVVYWTVILVLAFHTPLNVVAVLSVTAVIIYFIKKISS